MVAQGLRLMVRVWLSGVLMNTMTVREVREEIREKKKSEVRSEDIIRP